MLALTAIHDVMKNELLLPTVQETHARYRSFEAGTAINDHDAALAYVLEHYGACLPSYAALSEAQKAAILFTQAEISFNHGWLVQAEAPPGELFSQFKKIIATQRIRPPDIAFFFVHWLTDLAGAEPTPLCGSEKFVLRFPHALLHSFIESFSFVEKLADQSETEVYEEYLQWRWRQISIGIPEMGDPPTGNYAVALMRLVVAAQIGPIQKEVLRAFNEELAVRDQYVLSHEMALSAVPSKPFRTSPAEKEGVTMGPAFLIYYAPQFIRTAGEKRQTADGLSILAEVYRQARQIWPLSAERSGVTVTVRIDQMKDREPVSIQDGHQWGDGWLLVKRNEVEAAVEKRPLYTVNSRQPSFIFRLLCIWKRLPEDEEDDNSHFEELELLRMQQETAGTL